MILVVGGHSRNVGKTSVVANLIRALTEFEWTAIKITQFGHGICSAHGEPCECEAEADHPFVITRETGIPPGTDSARYLAAGARESWWLRTRQGELGFAMPALRGMLARAPNVILESNSVMRFIRPDLYLVVLDPAVPDFKPSSRLYLDRADAFLQSGPGEMRWHDVAGRLLARRPLFRLGANYEIPPGLMELVRSRRPVPCAPSDRYTETP